MNLNFPSSPGGTQFTQGLVNSYSDGGVMSLKKEEVMSFYALKGRG